jgi:hypothetical protein
LTKGHIPGAGVKSSHSASLTGCVVGEMISAGNAKTSKSSEYNARVLVWKWSPEYNTRMSVPIFLVWN